MESFYFTSFGMVFCILLMIIYFSKKKINYIENKVYGYIIIVTFISCIAETYSFILVRNGVDPYAFNYLLSLKILFSCFFAWIYFFTMYIILVTMGDNKKVDKVKQWTKYYILFFLLIVAIDVFFLPVTVIKNGSMLLPSGAAVNLIYICVALCIMIMLGIFVKNIKNVNNKKFIPLYLLIVSFGLIVLIQKLVPNLLIINGAFVFITFVMYFTIENPDVNMLNEMSKNRELMEQGYEDKYNFLFEMTQEARNPLVNISNLSNSLRMEENPQKVKDGLLTLNNLVRQLDFSINNILNISSLDISKIKVVDNKYDLGKMCHDLEVRIKPEMSSSVEFYLTMPQQIPTLVGDYMKLRQILYSLLVNACRNTENGSINMKVNLIEKFDVARLIFNISDTGKGMPIEKINEILSSTGSLSQQEIDNLEKKEFNVKMCQKVVKIMGGNLMIKSNIGEGTEVILTIDQKVHHDKDNSILNQYENAIANYRKVLIVSQDKNKLGIIKKVLTDNHITYSNLYYGADAIDRIKAGKKFDFILVDDEMKEMTGYMTLKGMNEIEGFKTPVIIMLNTDKENIRNHYLEDGFADYLLLDNLENELNRIIEKY